MESHIRKLLTDYGEVSILWFDGLVNHSKYDPPRFHKLIRDLSPNTLINDRLGDGYDFITPEQFIPKQGIPTRTGKPPSGNDPGGDGFFKLIIFLFKIPGIRSLLRMQLQKYVNGDLALTPVFQQPYPSPEHFQPWETCMTLNSQWARKPDDKVKSLKQCIDVLVTCAVRGGNLALNTGPMPDGRIEPQQVERFREIGVWLKGNGESIYGTRGGPWRDGPWGGTTHRGERVFVHVLRWPGDEVCLAPIPAKIVSHRVLTGGEATVSQTDDAITISVPDEHRKELDTIIELTLDGPAAALRTGLVSSGSLAVGKKITASSTWPAACE
jgi:alpha-L-fucosidase